MTESGPTGPRQAFDPYAPPKAEVLLHVVARAVDEEEGSEDERRRRGLLGHESMLRDGGMMLMFGGCLVALFPVLGLLAALTKAGDLIGWAALLVGLGWQGSSASGSGSDCAASIQRPRGPP